MTAIVAASEVAAYLARHRPPTYHHVTVDVGPHRETGPAVHELVVAAALTEQLTLWPKGTALTIDYRPSGYAQTLAYPRRSSPRSDRPSRPPSSHWPSRGAG